jgi:hypothetical protein
MNPRYRQEVLNVVLAQILSQRGIISVPETILKTPVSKQKKMPDVLVSFRGLRTAIEGEVGYRKNAKEYAHKSAKERVLSGIAHIGVAIVYDQSLREVAFDNLRKNMMSKRMLISVITESGSTDFVEGDIAHLEFALKNAFEQLIQEDVVIQAVTKLDGAIERFATEIINQLGDIHRIAGCLGIRDLED